jgi:hypothetical protein
LIDQRYLFFLDKYKFASIRNCFPNYKQYIEGFAIPIKCSSQDNTYNALKYIHANAILEILKLGECKISLCGDSVKYLSEKKS